MLSKHILNIVCNVSKSVIKNCLATRVILQWGCNADDSFIHSLVNFESSSVLLRIIHQSRSQWPLFKAWFCGRLLAKIAGSNPAWDVGVPCECGVLSGGLCFGLITRPEESYRAGCVWVSSWSLSDEEALAQLGEEKIFTKCEYFPVNLIRMCLATAPVWFIGFICSWMHAAIFTVACMLNKWKSRNRRKRRND